MQRSEETEALIVRTVDYRDAHRIVTLLTANLGKVGAIAYGARSSKRRFAGIIQPFQLLRVMLKYKRGRDLLQLTDGDVLEAYGSIPKDPSSYASATYALELLRELTPEAEQDARPFELLVTFLRKLDSHGARAELMAALVLNALHWAGFAPALDRCAACGRPAPVERAGHFDTARGIVCTACGGHGPILRGRVRAGLLQAVRWQEVTACTDRDLAYGLFLLCNLAHKHLGKELRSWSLLGKYLKALESG